MREIEMIERIGGLGARVVVADPVPLPPCCVPATVFVSCRRGRARPLAVVRSAFPLLQFLYV